MFFDKSNEYIHTYIHTHTYTHDRVETWRDRIKRRERGALK